MMGFKRTRFDITNQKRVLSNRCFILSQTKETLSPFYTIRFEAYTQNTMNSLTNYIYMQILLKIQNFYDILFLHVQTYVM